MDGREKLLKRAELFVLDLDGTFYLGDRMIEGAEFFLRAVEETGRRYLFFTNNSSGTTERYVEKLGRMGCLTDCDHVMTSGDVMIRFLTGRYPGKRVYLVGTAALEDCFRKAGICLSGDGADVVVVGFDTELTYEKLERACALIRNGAVYLATHPDVNCPVEDGFLPDCGAICAAISLSTGKRPRYVGKPFAETAEMIVRRTGTDLEKIAFVGDRLYTDVAAGVMNGAMGILVLTGETKKEDLRGATVVPDGVFLSLGEMGEVMKL